MADARPEEGPRVTLDNRQEAVALCAADLAHWSAVGEAALALIDEEGLARASSPSRVGVIIVDDETIARLHGEFLQDPAPTDVLTFPLDGGGEIVISIETAERQAAEYGNRLGRETCLYIVHGLLHLCGFDDRSAEERARMEWQQIDLLGRAEERCLRAAGRQDSAD